MSIKKNTIIIYLIVFAFASLILILSNYIKIKSDLFSQVTFLGNSNPVNNKMDVFFEKDSVAVYDYLNHSCTISDSNSSLLKVFFSNKNIKFISSERFSNFIIFSLRQFPHFLISINGNNKKIFVTILLTYSERSLIKIEFAKSNNGIKIISITGLPHFLEKLNTVFNDNKKKYD